MSGKDTKRITLTECDKTVGGTKTTTTTTTFYESGKKVGTSTTTSITKPKK